MSKARKHTVNTISDLTSDAFNPKIALVDKQQITVAGYHTVGDGGGGEFWWDGTSIEAVDGGMVIAHDADGPGRFRRLPTGPVSVRGFGAIGDGVADDTAAFNAAIHVSGRALYIPVGAYRLTGLLTFSAFGLSVNGDGKDATRLFIDHSNGGIVFDNTRQSLNDLAIYCMHEFGSSFGISIPADYFSANNVWIDWTGENRKFKNSVVVPAHSRSPWVRDFQNCTFRSASHDCFYVESASFNHATFYACSFTHAGRHGFHLAGSSSHGISFHGCRAENNALDGFRIAGRRGNHASFHGIYLEHNGSVGIRLGYNASEWNASAEYMESCDISGLSAWQQGESAVVAEKCIGANISGASFGANESGYFRLGAIRSGWPDFPLKTPQIRVFGINKRGRASDYNLFAASKNIMLISGDGWPSTMDQGWAPSSNIMRAEATNGRIGDMPAGAYACNSITLGLAVSPTTPGVSAFASENCALGDSTRSAVVAGAHNYLESVPDNSTLNGIISSDFCSWDTLRSVSRQIILSSHRVKSSSDASVCGGFASAGEVLSANRTWEIGSVVGDITISGSLSCGSAFSGMAEIFPNATGDEIPPGTILTVENGAVRPADDGEWIVGVVSHSAALLAGNTPFSWHGRYLFDNWGRRILEEVIDETTGERFIAQAEDRDWQPSLSQIPRIERPQEYTPVGMIGKIRVRVEEDVKAGDKLKARRGVGVPSHSVTGLRAIKLLESGIALCVINIKV